MPTYAIGHLRDVVVGPEIVAYIERMDATLAPFGGRFRVHGGPVEVLEGAWPGDLVIIEFPDRGQAQAWYASAAYQAILPLRTGNARSNVILVDLVDEPYRATDVLARIEERPRDG